MPSRGRDYYSVLGILRDSSPEEVRRAYYASARRFHPDQNQLPGETELFLEVQRAYEVLSNPERRAQYDKTLPDEAEDANAPVQIRLEFSRQSLVKLHEPQLVYVLLEAVPSERTSGQSFAPLNVCLVLDHSTSMQGEKIDLAKAAAIRILQMLRPEDLFSLVVFGDRAEVLLPAALQHDLKRAQSRIQAITTSGATELLRGLTAGVAELRRNLDPNRCNHLVLVTDGHTYGDETACLALADEAASLNIGISGFGVGGDWNDIFLDSLVGRTGGNSTYVAQPQDIPTVLIKKFTMLARTLVDDAVLEFEARPGIELRGIQRLQPEGGPVEVGELLHLGPITQDVSLSVLFEFVIQPSASQADSVTLLDGTLRAVVAARPVPFPPIRLRMIRPSLQMTTTELPPPAIVSALSRLSLYRLQERARRETDAGEYESATRHLRNLAVQLKAQGHHELSRTALLEAESIESRQTFSEQGSKQVKYGTRALMQPGSGETP